MKTVIIDKNSGEIRAVFPGPKDRHTIGNFQVAIEYDGDTTNKIGQEIDGTWQLIDDVSKIIEGERAKKAGEISSFKDQLVEEGFPYSGEKVNGDAWEMVMVNIPYSGQAYHRIRHIAGRKSQSGGASNFRNGKAVIILPGKEKISINSEVELQNFIDDYLGHLDQILAAEAEKIQELLLLETVEDIRDYPADTGWE